MVKCRSWVHLNCLSSPSELCVECRGAHLTASMSHTFDAQEHSGKWFSLNIPSVSVENSNKIHVRAPCSHYVVAGDLTRPDFSVTYLRCDNSHRKRHCSTVDMCPCIIDTLKNNQHCMIQATTIVFYQPSILQSSMCD